MIRKSTFWVAFAANCALSLPAIASPLFVPIEEVDRGASAGLLAATEDLTELAATDAAVELTKDEDGAVDGMVMLSDVLFDFGEGTLAPGSIATLETVAPKIKGIEKIEIIGHTDALGSTSVNHKLGLERAESVRSWLIEHAGLAPDAVTVKSAGETAPIAANTDASGADNPEGRAKNRRVEFHFGNS